ncbi:hypothetical protein [Rugamonas aquatica]|uniref:Uncharacterized protein n=1 Tax=Rugamonas aquatica TaxID=2743357 RepID=A0A6A7N412_9BURK|nr:hypothetical protein [Rugamonas aquatica]MQA39621.1 hypothetical protein [Rugamonas aquatica]
MGRIPASRTAGLDLVDKLFFNQILVHCIFTEELCWLLDLNEDLERELKQRSISGLRQQIVSHAVLCMMEAELSESLMLLNDVFPGKLPRLPDGISIEQYESVETYHKHVFQGIVLAVLSKVHHCDIQLVVQITNTLLPKYAKAPATVRYRLVERMFSFEFMGAPFDCFIWLCKMGVLKSDKHAGRTLTAKYSTNFLPRLALLCEYDMLRGYCRRAGKREVPPNIEEIGKIRKLSRKTIRLLLDQIAKVMDVNNMPDLKNSFPVAQLDKLEDPASIQDFFKRLNSYAVRFRVFRGSLASWVGMLCGGSVEILHRLDGRKTAIFVNDFNAETLTERVRKGMSARGIEITARVIYDRHRDFKESTLRIVEQYYRMHFAANVAISPDLEDMAYGGLAPHFELFKPSPRRKEKTA